MSPDNVPAFADGIYAREAGAILGPAGRPLTPETVHRYRREGRYRGRFLRLSARLIIYSKADIEQFKAECTLVGNEFGET